MIFKIIHNYNDAKNHLEEIKEMSDLQDKMSILLEGGYVGIEGKTLSFGQDDNIFSKKKNGD